MATQRQSAPSGQVSVGEVNRNVVDLRATLQEFIGEVRANYVRQDVYKAEREAASLYVDQLERRVNDTENALEQTRKDAAANRRLAITGLVYPLIVGIVVGLILAVLT